MSTFSFKSNKALIFIMPRGGQGRSGYIIMRSALESEKEECPISFLRGIAVLVSDAGLPVSLININRMSLPSKKKRSWCAKWIQKGLFSDAQNL